MKKPMKILALLLVMSGLVYLSSCKKHHDPTPISLTTIVATGDIDLNGVNVATGVPIDASIVITFTTPVDPATATNTNITLTRSLDQEDVPLTIATAGAVVTVTPNASLVGGLGYQLALGAGIKATNGLAFAAVTRSFVAAGTYAPSGALAHWAFESNANDETGTYSPAANDIVAITYVDSRNAAAGKAAMFNGTTSIIEIPNGPTLATATDFALSLWVKPDTAAHHGGNFVMGIGGSHGFQFEMNKTDCKFTAQYDIGDGSVDHGQDLWLDGTGNTDFVGWTFSKDLRPPGYAALVDQLWTHLVFTYVGATKIGSIYLNGELVKTQNFNSYPDGSPFLTTTGLKYWPDANLGEKLAIGFYNDRASTYFDFALYSHTEHNHFSGALDDIRIYHKVITAQDVTLMYQSEK